MQLDFPYSFSPGTKIISSQVNANNSAIAAVVNGGLQEDNFTTLTGPITWSLSGSNKAVVISSAGSAAAVDITASGTGVPLSLTSTTRGMLLPRMTTTQRDAIASPVDSETIYNTTTNRIESYSSDDGEWVSYLATLNDDLEILGSLDTGGSISTANGNLEAPQGNVEVRDDVISGRVFPEGGSRAYLKAPTSLAVTVGDNGGSTGELPIVVSENPGGNQALKIIRGDIDSTGTIVAGEGFSVSAATGGATITFTTAFSAAPVIVVTGKNVASRTTWSINAISASSAQVLAFDSTGATASTDGFNFIAIGPR